MIKIYVASSWRNSYQPGMVDYLRKAGFEVYDFKDPNNSFHWRDIYPGWENWTLSQYIKALKHPLAIKGFENDFNNMEWADICVLVLPCGRSAHSEAGWMKGRGKKVFVYIPDKIEPELMYMMYDGIFGSREDLLQAIGAGVGKKSKKWWYCTGCDKPLSGEDSNRNPDPLDGLKIRCSNCGSVFIEKDFKKDVPDAYSEQTLTRYTN